MAQQQAKRFVHLSDKSIATLCDWCSKNPGPDAQNWEAACIAVGAVMALKRVADTHPRVSPALYYPLFDLAAQFRDTVGREILKRIKEEK